MTQSDTISISYSIRAALYTKDETGALINAYSSIELSIETPVTLLRGDNPRDVAKKAIKGLGNTLRAAIHDEAAKMGMVAVIDQKEMVGQ